MHSPICPTSLPAVFDLDPAAAGWLDRVQARELDLHWPALVYAEISNTARELIKGGALARDEARELVEISLLAPAEVAPLESLVAAALEVASDRGLTVYEACYAVLAEGLQAPLITADGPLAGATQSAVLVGASG